jgi:hypothetical protein
MLFTPVTDADSALSITLRQSEKSRTRTLSLSTGVARCHPVRTVNHGE